MLRSTRCGINMRTPEEFKRQAQKMDITYWPSHKCCICNMMVGTEINGGEPSYNSSCGCVTTENHSYGWEYVAERYNIQSSPIVIQKMDEFWGFEPKVDECVE
jgi:hypothetical protein